MNFFEDRKDQNQDQDEELTKPSIDLKVVRETLAKNGYSFLRPIGKGGFASVFLIFSSQYNLQFVVKVSDYKGSRKNESKDSSNSGFDLNEINNLINLNHPNIINMYKYFTDDHYLYIVLEYCEGGSLDDLLKQNGPIRPPTLYNYCYQILTALKHCHDLKIAHSDLKPANVLIDKNKRLKLADFGLSKGLSPKLFHTEGGEKSNINDHSIGKNGQILTKHFGGSKPYMSPELIQLTAYDPFKADIWALGVTFYKLATGRLPWDTTDLKEMKMSIMMGVFSFQNTKLPPAFCNIIHRMLEVKPSKRATLEWLLSQSIFSNSPKPAEKGSFMVKSPSFGSQANLLSNVNSFRLGNRNDKIKLNRKPRNNSSLNIIDKKCFSTISSDTNDDVPDSNLQIADVPCLDDQNGNISLNQLGNPLNRSNGNFNLNQLINPTSGMQTTELASSLPTGLLMNSNNFGLNQYVSPPPNNIPPNLPQGDSGLSNSNNNFSLNKLLNNSPSPSNKSKPNLLKAGQINNLDFRNKHLLYPGSTSSRDKQNYDLPNIAGEKRNSKGSISAREPEEKHTSIVQSDECYCKNNLNSDMNQRNQISSTSNSRNKKIFAPKTFV